MKIISVNVGTPQPYFYKGKTGFTSIFKAPVSGMVNVSKLNVEGDEQSDLKVHGGILQAVYAYDVSYYNFWKKEIERDDWGYGLFGENLTTEGLSDDIIFIGDIYQMGSARLQAIQPRFPCYKLNIRFQKEDMLQQFAKQPKHGTYFSVVQEGILQAGDKIELITKSAYNVSIKQLVEAYYNKGADKNLAKLISEISLLPEKLRKTFAGFL